MKTDNQSRDDAFDAYWAPRAKDCTGQCRAEAKAVWDVAWAEAIGAAKGGCKCKVL